MSRYGTIWLNGMECGFLLAVAVLRVEMSLSSVVWLCCGSLVLYVLDQFGRTVVV